MPNQDPTQPGTPPPELHGLDPGELLARGLHTVKASADSGPWEPPTPEDLARLLPQYLIESLLGRGGMGAVYQGVQVALDRPVAIKLLPAEIAADGDFIARFQREARTLAKLQHSGIVTVYDFGQTSEGHLYFVMEYVDGTDLQRILKGPGLKPEQAFELIAQICDALYYAHRQGVIHRDIKPANILLTKDGRAKVADFGLARPIAEDSGGLTQTNMVMGTPDYMAPETRTSATHGDHRADIFALGVMLYEMLTGHRPQGAFQPPSHRVQVDVRIDEVVLKALQQEPDRRYQQASEMKVDVDRIRTTPPEKAKKPVNKFAIAAAIVLPLLALVGWWVMQSEPKSAASSLPWQKAVWSDQDRARVSTDGWLPTGDELKSTEPQRVPGERLKFTDGALRALVRFQAPSKYGSVVSVWVRMPFERSIQFLITHSEIKATLNGNNGAEMGRIAFDTPFRPGDVEKFEAAAVGNQFVVRFKGKQLSFLCPEANRNGAALFHGQNYGVKDVEYVILDGIPDPLKALGWEVAAAAGGQTVVAAKSGSGNTDQIVEWVFKSGGEVTVRQGGNSVKTKDPKQIPVGKFDLTEITMRGESVTDEEFARLGSMPTLQRINLQGASKITSLKPLAGLTQLRFLVLPENVGLTEEELAHLSGLEKLEWLELRLPDATGEAFRHLSGLKKLTQLSLHEGKLTEAGGKAVASLSSLTYLTLSHCLFQDNQEALAPIGQMLNLTGLGLAHDDVTAKGFSSLAGLKKLGNLNLSDSRIDNAGFSLLTGSRGTLKVLNVDLGATVSDEGIRNIVATFPNLEEINVSQGSTCTAASIRELAKLPNLKKISCWVMKGLKPNDYTLFADLPAIERLSIEDTNINDEALQSFAKCEHLIGLALMKNAITDAGLKALINIRPLKVVTLSYTKITAAGLADFQKARPDVKVLHNLDAAPAGAVPPSMGTSTSGVAEAKKRLVEARAHLKAGDAAETRKITEEALSTAPGDLTTQAEAALILAVAQAPERAAALAQEFVAQAEAEHPQFAAMTELRVKLTPLFREYEKHLSDAAKLPANALQDELREIKAALALVPDGGKALAARDNNPVYRQRPLPGRHWEIPLGEAFVPVDGLPNVLFSVWETRVKDFEQFVKETNHDMSAPRSDSKTFTWQQPGFEQTGDHPVVMVSRDDADAFCRWLTQKERAAGRLLPGQVFRLPTDREWSAAMGVLNEPGDFPEDRKSPKDVFPWTKDTQPARNAENLNWKNDDFTNTAPVGSGQPNRFGIYDLLGNVKEICADFWSFTEGKSVLRGSSFNSGEGANTLRATPPFSGGVGELWQTNCGFRCVLDLKTEEQRRVQIALEAAVEKFQAYFLTQTKARMGIRTLVNDEMVLLNMYPVYYGSEKALSFFSDIPVTHLIAGGGNHGSTEAMKKWPLRVVRLNTLFVKEDFLESFRGLPLENIQMSLHLEGGMKIKNLAPLAAMKLKRLQLDGFKNLESLEPLRGMPLEDLRISGLAAKLDFTPLKDAPIRHAALPESISLDMFFQVCEWWGPRLTYLSANGDKMLSNMLRESALAGDAVKVNNVATATAARVRAIPYLQTRKDNFLSADTIQKNLDLYTRWARWVGGDRTALDRLFKTFDGHSYVSIPWLSDLAQAKEEAQKLGGHLLTVTTKAENDFIAQNLQSGALNGKLLGLERTGPGRMDWKWVTGEPLDYHNWGPESGMSGNEANWANVNGKWVWYHGSKGWPTTFIVEWDTPTPQPPAAAK